MRFASEGLAVCLVLLSSVSSAPAGPEDGRSPHARDELIRYAESLLVKDSRSTYATANFEVVSDCPDRSAAPILASNFEAVFHVLDALFPTARGKSPSIPGKVRTYLFQSRQQYKLFETFVQNGARGRSAGIYFEGYGILAFHLEMYVQPAVRAVMVHECVHAYIDRRLKTARGRFPSWLGEGLAEYVALSDVEDGKIQVGTYSAKTRYETRYVTRTLPSFAAERLSDARRAARHRKEDLSFEYLFHTVETSIEKESRALEFYAVCWLLVDFLVHGRPEWAESAFPKFLTAVGAGEPALEVLEREFGRSAADLEGEFREYVKRFKLPLKRPSVAPGRQPF